MEHLYKEALEEIKLHADYIPMPFAEYWLLKYGAYIEELLVVSGIMPYCIYNLGTPNELVEFYNLFGMLDTYSEYYRLVPYSDSAMVEHRLAKANNTLADWTLKHIDFFLEHLNPFLFQDLQRTREENGNIYTIGGEDFKSLITFGGVYYCLFFKQKIIPEELYAYKGEPDKVGDYYYTPPE